MSDEADVVEYRDMLTIIRDRVRAMMESGMTADEIVRARPTRDYDSRYGADSGPAEPAQFVGRIYQSLQRR